VSGFSILQLDEVDSTSDYARQHLAQLEDREVVAAERQTRGRGKIGRRWLCPGTGNLAASIVLKPFQDAGSTATPAALARLGALTHYASYITSELLDDYPIHTTLKWPNDILVDGAKIAGVLCQSFVQGQRHLGCIVGIGVNLNMTEEDLVLIDQPAAALNRLIGGPVDRDSFLTALLARFFSDYEGFLRRGFPWIREKFKAKAAFLGKHITVHSLERRYAGLAKDIDSDGALILVEDSGEEVRISLGDIL
jgi:BirA family biotin operon repressor/biotin-[acetyl-CoA-carboxylase] ligase